MRNHAPSFNLQNWWKSRKPFFRPYSLRTTAHIANSRCIISHSHKFLYFRIPKAANSTITSTLYRLQHGHTSPPDGKKIKSSFQHPDKLSRAEAATVKESYFKFSVVRNPYDRLLSAYLDKIKGNSLRQKRKVTNALKLPEDSEVEFDLFLDYLEQHSGTLDDAHWAIQTDMIFMPLSELDFLGRMENLSTDLAKIVSTIFGIEDFEIERQTQRVTNARARRHELLNSNQIKRITEIYRKDFELLGYEIE